MANFTLMTGKENRHVVLSPIKTDNYLALEMDNEEVLFTPHNAPTVVHCLTPPHVLQLVLSDNKTTLIMGKEMLTVEVCNWKIKRNQTLALCGHQMLNKMLQPVYKTSFGDLVLVSTNCFLSKTEYGIQTKAYTGSAVLLSSERAEVFKSTVYLPFFNDSDFIIMTPNKTDNYMPKPYHLEQRFSTLPLCTQWEQFSTALEEGELKVFFSSNLCFLLDVKSVFYSFSEKENGTMSDVVVCEKEPPFDEQTKHFLLNFVTRRGIESFCEESISQPYVCPETPTMFIVNFLRKAKEFNPFGKDKNTDIFFYTLGFTLALKGYS